MKQSTLRLGGALAGLALVLTACGGGAEDSASGNANGSETSTSTAPAGGSESGGGGGGGEKVVIGAALPLSGGGSYFGVQDKAGIETALAQFPDLKDKVEIHYEDSACSPLEATNAAERL